MSEVSLYKLNQDLISKADKLVATNTTNGLMSISDKIKLDSISANANNYTLPMATISILGGVKIGSGITVDGNGIITVPNATTSVNGLMLFTDKVKLDGIAVNANNYTLPKATISSLGGVIVSTGLSIDTSGLLKTNTTQIKADIGVATTSTNGLMSAADKTRLDAINDYTLPTASTSVLGGIKVGPGLNISYGILSVPNVSTAADGLMSSADKLKLDGITSNANNYILPTASTSILGGVKIGTGIGIDGSGVISISNATTSTSGLMSMTDKSKLDNIATNANNYVLPIASGAVIGGIRIGTGITIDGSGIASIVNASSAANGLMTAADKVKLDDIAYQANNYTLPTASATVLGGIKVGNGLSINSGILSVPLSSPIINGLMASIDKAKLDSLGTVIPFGFVYPMDNGESPRYIVKRSTTLSEVDIYSTIAPTADVSIQIFKNSVVISTIVINAAGITATPLSNTFAIGDIIYAKINGAINGITNLTVELVGS